VRRLELEKAVVDVAVGSGGHCLLARFEETAVLIQQLLGATPLGVFVVPLDVYCESQRCASGNVSATTATPLSNGNDRLHTWLRQCATIVDRGDLTAEAGWVDTIAVSVPGRLTSMVNCVLPESLQRYRREFVPRARKPCNRSIRLAARLRGSASFSHRRD
jgi:hypothetical protein